jgi:YD repeat-containing protein
MSRPSRAQHFPVVLMLTFGFLAASTPANAQAPSEFERIGVQLHRDYLRLQPFELLDTQSGNVILTIPMLSLPGNAGRSLDFRLTYNANIMTVGVAPWVFGIAGMPLRVDEQATPDPGPDLPITIAETWGITPLVHMADGGRRRTMFMADPRTSTRLAITSSFWKYDRDENKLYLPDGTVCTYAADPDGRLTEIRDVYDNTVTLTWGPNTLLVVQDLGNSQSRQIEFDLNTAALPTFMRFDGRTWQYHYENGNDEELSRTTPPHGPGWTFGYDVVIDPFRRLTSVTTPHGGQIEYEHSPHWLTPTDYQILLDWRRTTDRGGTTPDAWHIEYSPTPSGYSAQTTVTTPTDRRITYVYEPIVLSNPQINPELLIDGGIALVSTTIEGLVGGNWFPFESEQRAYTQVPTVWWANGTTHFDASVSWQRTISRGGPTYTTTLAYANAGPNDNFGDYHQPNQITEVGELSRTITRSYFHGATPYVRGQIASETVTVEGESWTRTWSYETATGFKTRQTEFGSTADDGIATTFTRDDRGNVRTVTTATQKTTFDYSWGQVGSTQTPEYTTTRSINHDGTIASQTSAGRTTQFVYEPHYDAFRLKQTQPPGSTNPIVVDYDLQGGAWVRTTRGPTIDTTALDGFGRPVRADENSIGVATRTEYDAEGRIVYEGYPFTGTADLGAALEYDALHRLTRRTNPDATSSTRSYGAGTVTLTDEEGRTTVQTWGAFGDPDQPKLLGLRDPRNQTWNYTYHALGQLRVVTAPDLTTRTWLYNAQNRLSSETHPESGVVRYLAYDPAGNLTRRSDANGTVFEYTYDGNNRLRTVTAQNRVTTITYESGSDNRLWMRNGDLSSTFAYDAAGRLAQRQDEIGGFAFTTTYGYNANDHVTTLTYPSGRIVRYDRDGAGRIMRVFETAASRDYAFGMAYHAAGALATYTAGNKIPTTNTYDPARYWARSITAGALQLTYSQYDAVGNVLTIRDSRPGMGHTFTYDGLDRLETVTGPSYFAGYNYDAHGNRQTAYANTYVYDPATLRLIEQNGEPLTYDANGNLQTTATGTFTHTAENMLASAVVTGGSTITYAYDPDNWRVKRTTRADVTYYVRGLQGELLTEFTVPATGDTIARDYVYAGSRLLSAVKKTTTLPSNDIYGTISPNGPSVTQSVPAGKRVLLQFTGTAGHRYRAAAWLTAGDFGCGAWLELRTAAGDLVANAASSDGCSSLLSEPVILPATGTYFVVLDPLTSSTGTAVARLYDIYGTINPDGSINALTATNGQPLLMEFQAVAGQRYSVVGNLTNGALGSGWLDLRTAQWVQVPRVLEALAYLHVLTSSAMASSTVHFVAVDPSGTNTGTVDITLHTVVDVVGAITLDGPAVNVTVTTPGQNARLTFGGTAGQRISFWGGWTPAGSFNLNTAVMRLMKPDGTQLASTGIGPFGWWFLEPATLPVSGTYTAVIDPSMISIGTARVRLYDVVDLTGSTTIGGSGVELVLTKPGQNATLTFAGTVGQRISVAGATNTTIILAVRKPDGTTLSSTSGNDVAFVDAIALPVAGTYSVLVDPMLAVTGTTTVTIYEVVDGTGTVTMDGPAVPVTVTAPGQKIRLTFPGVAGQRITAWGTNNGTSWLYVPLAVLKPDGTTLGSVNGGVNAFLEPPVLPVSGTYTVLIDPYKHHTGSGAIRLYDVADVTGAITINGPAVAVTTTKPGQKARLTFNGTAGQRINSVGTRVSSTGWLFMPFAILKPDGSTLGSVSAGGGPASLGPLTLPTSGPYTVLVDPYQTATGTASVTVTQAP